MIEQAILDAFETMWGPFPEPVLLIDKDRTILAGNELARTAGIPAGAKCFSLNPGAVGAACNQCKANLALREHRTVCTELTLNGEQITAYWMPLRSNSDVYVHFGFCVCESMSRRNSSRPSSAVFSTDRLERAASVQAPFLFNPLWMIP